MKLKLFSILLGVAVLTSCTLPNLAMFNTEANDPDTSYWDQIIEQDPSNADAYFQRAKMIYVAATPKGSLAIYKSKLDRALQDIDQAIVLRSNIGDYYALRQSILYYRAAAEEYDVDSQYLYEMALDNAYKSYELGSYEDYPDRLIIIDLIGTNQCQKALDEAQKLIVQAPPADISIGGLLHIRSQAYACLGKLEDALKSVNDSMFNNVNMGHKQDLKAQYLLMLGRYDEALPIINERIRDTTLTGYLHYMRAEVYYNIGEKDLIQNELKAGKSGTWGRGGWLAYVEAQMALDDGRIDDAIKYLQQAEATFDPTYNPLRWEIQEQLQALGAQPLKLTPSVQHQATPIP